MIKLSNTILVTGGAGFIGANFVLDWLAAGLGPVVNLDLLTYAGNTSNIRSLEGNQAHIFVRGNIGDRQLVDDLLHTHKPCAIVNFAAESHVDRSIASPLDFVQTNVNGTYALLEAGRNYWSSLDAEDKDKFRFLHISTDEVYGSLEPHEAAFTEKSVYQPNSPYSASKGASDHLVRAWHHTYGLPTLTTNCSNNYGPYQFPEKLIPLMIVNAIAGKALPIYGTGENVRDWLFVGDHCAAVRTVLHKATVGETYNIGGNNERTNIEVVQTICNMLDARMPLAQRQILHPVSGAPLTSYSQLITFVKDRPGHDKRYAIDSSKLQRDLNWKPVESFETGIAKTIDWYINNQDWIINVAS